MSRNLKRLITAINAKKRLKKSYRLTLVENCDPEYYGFETVYEHLTAYVSLYVGDSCVNIESDIMISHFYDESGPENWTHEWDMGVQYDWRGWPNEPNYSDFMRVKGIKLSKKDFDSEDSESDSGHGGGRMLADALANIMWKDIETWIKNHPIDGYFQSAEKLELLYGVTYVPRSKPLTAKVQ